MAMPKSPSLFKGDANHLRHYSARAKDPSLTIKQRRNARKARNVLMLSLRRAGWTLPSIAEGAQVLLTVAREQIVVLPSSTKSVEVTAPSGDKVTPDPLKEEFSFSGMTDVEIRTLQALAPVANQYNFSYTEESPAYQASFLLDGLLAYLYDVKKRKPISMAKAIASSNSLVRQRIYRAKGKDTPRTYPYGVPDFLLKGFEQYIAEIDAADAAAKG